LYDQINDLEIECLKKIEKLDSNSSKKSNAIVNCYKIRIDNIKWSLSKLVPKKYGDKIEVDNNHSFPDGIKINFTRGDRKPGSQSKSKQKNKSDD